MFAGVAAVLVILMTIYMILNLEASLVARGKTPKVPIEMVVLGDLAAITGFSVLISVGISSRHRPASSDRLEIVAWGASSTAESKAVTRFTSTRRPRSC